MAEGAMKSTFREFTESPEAYSRVLSDARASNPAFPDIGIEKLLEIESNAKVELDQSGVVAETHRRAAQLAHELLRLPWTIVRAEEGAPSFILSDAPVTVLAYEAAVPGATLTRLPPGCVALALGQRVALMSNPRFVRTRVATADKRGVAQINGFTLRGATAAYSRGPDFVWMNPKGQVRHASDAASARHC
jgi:hypothetical protein